MCKVSEETILKANERMRKYKIGETFTKNSINAIFERVLSNRQHGKAL